MMTAFSFSGWRIPLNDPPDTSIMVQTLIVVGVIASVLLLCYNE